jgi:hypothetical protein
MYLPESHAQMFDILTELRLYAAMNGLPRLAEQLDDALMLLAAEGARSADPKATQGASAVQDTL